MTSLDIIIEYKKNHIFSKVASRDNADYTIINISGRSNHHSIL